MYLPLTVIFAPASWRMSWGGGSAPVRYTMLMLGTGLARRHQMMPTVIQYVMEFKR
jgi:hypothetical protein